MIAIIVIYLNFAYKKSIGTVELSTANCLNSILVQYIFGMIAFLIEEVGQEIYNEDSYCSEGTGKTIEGTGNSTNSNTEIRVVDMKEFNSQVWTSWLKNHDNGKGMTMSEYNAVYNVYSAGLRESDFANYSDYEKVVYLAAVEVYENKYNMTPEEFLMVMFGVIAQNNIKINGTYSKTKSGDVR